MVAFCGERLFLDEGDSTRKLRILCANARRGSLMSTSQDGRWKVHKYLGLRSIGKSGFRFWNRTRNPSSEWISIKKSKSGFRWFPFHRSIGKSEKGFEKLFSWTAVFFLLIMRARARPLFLRTVFQIVFRISQSNGENENPKTDISALKSVYGFRVRLQIRNPDF